MKIKFIMPAFNEVEGSIRRSIKYSLFPPLGLVTLAGYLLPSDEVEVVNEHVQKLYLDDDPDIVAIQVYISNAYRAYRIANHYRKKGIFVILGGLHVTSLPKEAKMYADSIIIGPGEGIFSTFLSDYRKGKIKKVYISKHRSLIDVPPLRRDLIKRRLYLVPNSLIISRGCPYHCEFCYKDSFFKNGKSFYTKKLDDVLNEIEQLKGRHLYFLDDHLFGAKSFVRNLFYEMRSMNRIFQGAATVDSILNSDLIDLAAEVGLKSIFIGFESLNFDSLKVSNKRQNINKDYEKVINRLHDLGVMINASFVFGLDGDNKDVFKRTVDWALEMGITTATFHIATPYPGTAFYKRLKESGRIITENWDLYNTRNVTFIPVGMTCEELKNGYDTAYKYFYEWGSIFKASSIHDSLRNKLKHFFYTSGWRKLEPLWNIAIQMKILNCMTPLLESILTKKQANSKPTQEESTIVCN